MRAVDELLKAKVLLPAIKRPADFDIVEFFSEYGRYIAHLAIVIKNDHGEVFYESSCAPCSMENARKLKTCLDLASALDIEYTFLVYCFSDTVLSKRFGVVREGVETPPFDFRKFICPNKPEYRQYLSEIIREIEELRPSSIVLMDVRYPWRNFCFCKRCRSEFAEYAGSPTILTSSHYLLEVLQQYEQYYEMWLEWRSKVVSEALAEILSKKKEGIPVYVEIILDPVSEMYKGLVEFFAQDIEKMAQFVDGFMVNLFPYSGVPNERVTIEILEPLLATNKDVRIFYEGKIDDRAIKVLRYISSKLESERVFINIGGQK